MKPWIKTGMKILLWLVGIGVVSYLGVVIYIFFFVHLPFRENMQKSFAAADQKKQFNREYIQRHNGKFNLEGCNICIPVQEPSGVFYRDIDPSDSSDDPFIRLLSFVISYDYICQNSKEPCSSNMDLRFKPSDSTYVSMGVIIYDPKAGIIDDLFGGDQKITEWKNEENLLGYNLYTLDPKKIYL
ncbi:MAG: hypothetical protein K1X44_00045 [Alphaproteobacteria bacterium]|nr:hypothetical protein [Alphaproteobacteria bacterium]